MRSSVGVAVVSSCSASLPAPQSRPALPELLRSPRVPPSLPPPAPACPLKYWGPPQAPGGPSSASWTPRARLELLDAPPQIWRPSKSFPESWGPKIRPECLRTPRVLPDPWANPPDSLLPPSDPWGAPKFWGPTEYPLLPPQELALLRVPPVPQIPGGPGPLAPRPLKFLWVSPSPEVPPVPQPLPSPSQNSPLTLPKPRAYDSHPRQKSVPPSWRRWNTWGRKSQGHPKTPLTPPISLFPFP